MNSKDKIYQDVLNMEVNKFSLMSITELKLFEDYGEKIININGLIIHIGWWKYKINENEYHFIFKTSRKSFLFLNKPFINGLKLIEKKIEKLVGNELANYD